MQGCRPLTEEVYSIEKVVEKGIVMELATTSRKFPKSFRPMEALGQDLAAHVSQALSSRHTTQMGLRMREMKRCNCNVCS